jgi:hypothetical protein
MAATVLPFSKVTAGVFLHHISRVGQSGKPLHFAQSGEHRYDDPARTFGRIHHTTVADGILYPSRNNYPAACIAMFSRAAQKIVVIRDVALPDHGDWPAFVSDFGITVLPR